MKPRRDIYPSYLSGRELEEFYARIHPYTRVIGLPPEWEEAMDAVLPGIERMVELWRESIKPQECKG